MVGDWVSVLARFLHVEEHHNAVGGYYKLERKPCKVIGVYCDGESLSVDKSCHEVISYDPIVLTKEILEKNGWQVDGTSDCKFYWHKDVDFAIPLSGFESNTKNFHFISDYFGTSFFRFQYVHELQQALRLCRMNELADNFKI